MGNAVGITIMLVAAAVLQVVAAAIAVALVPVSGMRRSWAIVALALLLQAVRRVYLVGSGTTIEDAVLALAISVLLLAGVAGMRTVFLSHRMTKSLLDAERASRDEFAGKAGALVVLLDPEGRIREVNERTCEALGCDADKVRGRSWFETFVAPENRRELSEAFSRLATSAEDTDEYAEYEVLDTLGRPHAIVWHRRVLRDELGRGIGVRSAGIDLSERRALEEQLAFRSMLLDQTNDAVLVYALSGEIVYANERAAKYRGGLAEVRSGADMHDLLPAEEREAFDRHMETVAGGACVTFDSTGNGQDGVTRPLESHVCPVTLNDGCLVFEVARDVTERRRAEALVRKMAYTDPLTGLPNRSLLFDRAHVSFARARRCARSVAVLFLDLDAMKEVNDTFGHAAGDELLRYIGSRLGEAFRGEDTVARMGGDEFVVLADIRAPEGADAVAERVDRVMSEPFRLDAGDVSASFSVGIAVFPSDGEAIEDLLAKADAGMYAAKVNAGYRRNGRAARA